MLKKLNSRHKSIARMLVIGYSTEEICRELGIHKQTIIILRNDPLFTTHLNSLQTRVDDGTTKRLVEKGITDPVKAVLMRERETAVSKVVKLMNASDEKVQLSAAKDILDRAGDGAPDKSARIGVSIMIDARVMEDLQEALG